MKRLSEKEILENKISLSSARESFVYFLIKNSTIVYVGQTTSGLARVLSHCYNKDFDSYSTIPCPPENLDEMESDYIYKFYPKYNTSLPQNNKYISRFQLKKQYRIEGNALRRLIKLYGIKTNRLDCFIRKDIEDALKKGQEENIIYLRKGRNNDWYLS